MPDPDASGAASQTPNLGDGAGQAGLNVFRHVHGSPTRNMTGQSVGARQNDWGRYREEELAAMLGSHIEYENFLDWAVEPGTVFVDVVDGPTGAAVSAVAASGDIVAERHENTGLYVLRGLESSEVTLHVEAGGYRPESVTVDTGPNGFTAARVELTPA